MLDPAVFETWTKMNRFSSEIFIQNDSKAKVRKLVADVRKELWTDVGLASKRSVETSAKSLQEPKGQDTPPVRCANSADWF